MNPKGLYWSVLFSFGTGFASNVFQISLVRQSNGLLWRCCLLYADWLVFTLITSTEFQISEYVPIIWFFLDTKSC